MQIIAQIPYKLSFVCIVDLLKYVFLKNLFLVSFTI